MPLDAASLAFEPAPFPSVSTVLAQLEEIDQDVQRAAVRLHSAPHALPQIAPVLGALAAERSRCLRPLLDALASMPTSALGRLASLWDEGAGEAAAAPVDVHATEAATVPSEADARTGAAEADACAEASAAAEDNARAEASASAKAAESVEAGGVQPSPAPVSAAVAVRVAAEATPRPPEAASEGLAPMVSSSQLADFAARFRAKKSCGAPPTSMRDTMLLRRETLVREVLHELSPLPASVRELTTAVWLERLVRLSSDEWLARWSVLDKALQVDLLTLVVALTRAAQDKPPVDQDAVARVLVRLSAFSKREQPGFTHGLARKHEPRRASWLDDARQAEKSLRAWLGEAPASAAVHLAASGAPVASAAPRLPLVTLSASSEPTAAATAHRPGADHEAEDAPESEEAPPLVEDDWSFWSVVRGKRAVMFGGSPREPYRQRLLEVFGFASLDWIDAHVRRVDSLAERLAHARVDLVLVVLPFVGHKGSGKIVSACKRHGVPYALLEHGHGVLAVRRAIERFCPQKPGVLGVSA